MKLSMLIGAPVLSPEGETAGYVTCVFVAKSRNAISCLAAADREEEEFYLPARAFSIVGGAVTVNGSARLKSPSGRCLPLGRPCFTRQGTYLGSVKEVTLQEEAEGGKLILSVVNGIEQLSLPAERTTFKDAVIVKPARSAAKTEHNFTKKKKPVEVPRAEVSVRPQDPPCTAQTLYALNLMGKQVKRGVTDGEGRDLIAAGVTVTPAVIRKAAKNNRLIELIANALTE